MKRTLVALTLVLLLSLAVGAGVASATHSPGAGPMQSFAQGTTNYDFGDFGAQLHVNAKDELDPEGYFFAEQNSPFAPFEYRARVTCLDVTGNSARIGGEVTRSETPTYPEGSGVFIDITDNGEGSAAPPDQAIISSAGSAPPTTCTPGIGLVPNTTGNFVVHDGQP